ncbi:hypothetical protein MC7420_4380 [Coleofasciculus chthonoplastes PCC 7420]|uniref:Uncharacterized protein n=2 Tax=Coleofasciculus chthonoplastes TaxID=64178 RepID=B4VY64_9CYAN|nr:hypothetical protein MC7420_4380 [Coleofasciculus chthonoplastes PCC 7420]
MAMIGKLIAPVSGSLRKFSPLYLIPKSCRRWVFAFFVGLVITSLATPAKAQDSGFDQAIDQINTMSTTLATLTVLFTEVVVTPMGFSAAARTFRRVVIGNL